MEVLEGEASGRSCAQHELTSDEGITGNLCDPCSDDGITTEAVVYCTECSEYLCRNCSKQHRRFRGTRDHRVLEGINMPRVRPLTTDVEQCPEHPGRYTEMFCQSDSTLGCGLCFAVGHRACLNIKLISELSNNFESSSEMQTVHDASQQQKDLVGSCSKLIQDCRKDNADCYSKSQEDFQSFRSNMEAMLDQLGEIVSSDANEMKERNTKKLDSLTEQLEKLGEEMEPLLADIDEKLEKKHMDQLFIAVKRNTQQIGDILHRLKQLKPEVQIQKFEFQADPAIEQIIQNHTIIGKMKVLSVNSMPASGEITAQPSYDNVDCSPDTVDSSKSGEITTQSSDDKVDGSSPDTANFSILGEINAKSADDRKDCSINAIVEISPSVLVVTDWNNQCVKKIDVIRNVILQKLSLSSTPCCVAVLLGSRVAVTLPSQQTLQIISTNQGLVRCNKIAVSGVCIAVKPITAHRIVVSFINPGKVQILDLTGRVYKSFTQDTSGSPLLNCPLHLGLNLFLSSIYISDYNKNAVISLSTEGNIQWTYKDTQLKKPQGIDVGRDRCLYICSRDNDSIHVLSSAGVKQKVIATRKFNLKNPRAICLSKSQETIYLSSACVDPSQHNTIRRISLHQ